MSLNRRALATLLIPAITMLSVAAAHAADYYVSATGNDANSGSMSDPFASISKINSLSLSAGDRVFFEGGSAFSGNLFLSAEGSALNPITISSYGSGNAIINGGNSTGVWINNAGGYDISNLNIVGSGATSNTASGLYVFNDLSQKKEYVRVNNVEASGWGNRGIFVSASKHDGGFRDVRITNSVVHHNAEGLTVSANYPGEIRPNKFIWQQLVHEQVYVGHVTAHNNSGANGHQGSGIVLAQTDGGTVERSVAYGNGASGNGGVGIWAWESNGILIQHNEAYGNQTGGGNDGGGFDLDGGVTNSIVQFNYSHENEGAGLLLAQFDWAEPMGGNTFRYNISQNDGRDNNYGGITVWSNDGDGATGAVFHNNVIAISPNSAGNVPPVISFLNNNHDDIKFYNNVFYSAGNSSLIQGTTDSTRTEFFGNTWFGEDRFLVGYGGKLYTSWEQFIAESGQEVINGEVVGLNVDPMFTDVFNGQTFSNADLLHMLEAYKLLEGSPLINAGLDLQALFGINPGMTDFYGNPLTIGYTLDMGANESLFGYLPGDFNGDNVVDQSDLTLLLSYWGEGGAPEGWVAPFDGALDQNELTELLSNWGAGVEAAPASLPEPASAVLLMGGALVLLARRR